MPPMNADKKSIPTKKRTKSSSILLESTRQFCEIKRPTIEDISNYKAFFYQFIDTLPNTDKRQVAAILARNPFTPRPVGLYLAMDKLEVAAPFLLFSPILKEMDLNAISRKMGAEYNAVIKRRDDGNKILGVNEANIESSTGILNDRVSFKNKVVLDMEPSDNLALIPNGISRIDIKSSLEQLEVIPAEAKFLQEIKVEIAPAVNLTSNISDPISSTKTIIKDTNDEPIASDSVATKVEIISSDKGASDDEWLSSDEIVALASVGGKLGKYTSRKQVSKSIEFQDRAQKHVKRKPLTQINVRTLIRQARAVDHNGFSQTVSMASGLSAERVMGLINKKQGDELLYLIKAMDVPAPKDLQLLLMLSPRHGRGIEMYMSAKKQFSELNVGVCRMIFNEVGASFEIPGAPKAVHIEGTRQDENFSHSVKMRRAHISAISRDDAMQKQQVPFGKSQIAS